MNKHNPHCTTCMWCRLCIWLLNSCDHAHCHTSM